MKTIRAFFITVFILALVATIVMPIYLGPDDLDGCVTPGEGRCQAADAIVVVSGGDTAARTAEGVSLYKDGWAPLMIFSGAAKDPNSQSNAEAMGKQAVESEVPPNNILLEELAMNTEENAKNVADLVKDREIGRIILVTSAYHQRRTNIEFSKKMGDKVTILNHPVKNDSQWSHWWWATPYGWWLGGSELIKILFASA